jgi:ribonuclease P protein component
MKRKYRLKKLTDFKRVRRLGKSYAHPLIVLIKHPNDIGTNRIGISAGRSVGNAVNRNRCKRKIREALRPIINTIQPGWDIIFLARKPIAAESYNNIQSAVVSLLNRADLLNKLNVN